MDGIKFLPGPMEGVMQAPLLQAWLEIDAFELLMTPFLRITTGVPRIKILENYLTKHIFPRERLIVQLMGIDPELLADAAAKFCRLGVQGINFNFGCPSRQVISGGAGGGGLKNQALMRQTVERAREKAGSDANISVKLRTGFSSHSEMEQIIPELVASGVIDYLIVHFRTVEEQYRLIDDAKERFRRAVELAQGVKIYINGSIDCAPKAMELLAYSGADGVMSARGILPDPLLGRRIEGRENLPTPDEARKKVWEKILSTPVERSWLLELAAFSFGAEHDLTGELKRLKNKKVEMKNLHYGVI